MRRNDPRRPYEQAPDPPVNYHDLNLCRGCATYLQLGVAWRALDKDVDPLDGRWYVVTECRCGVYSTEAGGYASQAWARRKMRSMLAGCDAPAERTPEVKGQKRVYTLKTHCIHGHEFTPENTRIKADGRRVCRTCRKRHRDTWEANAKLRAAA